MQKIKNFFKRFPRHWVVAASAWGSRAVTAVIQVISVRALLMYLGEERYAAYTIAYSLAGWFALCDCGIGTALQNFISEGRARSENYDKYLRAALQISLLLIAVFLFLLFLLSPFIQRKIFTNYLHITEIRTVNIIAIVGAVVILSAIVNIIYKIYYAFQKGYVSNILPALSMIVSMTLIVLANRYSNVRESILLALLIFTFPQLITALIPFIKVFKGFFADILNFDFQATKELFLRSGKFFGFAIMAAATLQIDYIIMSQHIAPADITAYNILNKVFMLLLFIQSAVLSAAWPVCNELFNKCEFKTIKNMLKKYILFGASITLVGSALIYFFSDTIIRILAPGTSLNPAFIFFALFASYYLIRTWSDTFAMFLQSINALRIFWIYVPFQALISCFGQIYFSSKYGVYGILLGLIASFILTSCWVLPYKTWKVFKSRETA